MNSRVPEKPTSQHTLKVLSLFLLLLFLLPVVNDMSQTHLLKPCREMGPITIQCDYLICLLSKTYFGHGVEDGKCYVFLGSLLKYVHGTDMLGSLFIRLWLKTETVFSVDVNT